MSQDDRKTDEHDCGGDVAAYALGALDETEAATFRAHLEACAVCQDELAAFAQVVDTLPASVPAYRASRRLRRRVLRAIADEPGGARAPARRRSCCSRPVLGLDRRRGARGRRGRRGARPRLVTPRLRG